MSEFLIKKEGKYCHFYNYSEDVPLLNLAQYLVEQKIIKNNDEREYISSILPLFKKVENNFYKMDYIIYILENKKNIHQNAEHNFQNIQTHFLYLKEIKEKLKKLNTIVNSYKKDMQSVTSEDFKNYFNYDQNEWEFMYHNYGHISEKEREKVQKTYAQLPILEQAFSKKRYQFLTKALHDWRLVLNDEGEGLDVEEINDVSSYGESCVYALFLSRGQVKGFYSNKDGKLSDISQAKTFSHLKDAKRYCAIKKMKDVAFIKLSLNYVQVEEVVGHVNTTSLQSVEASYEKEKLESLVNREKLIKDLLALCIEEQNDANLSTSHSLQNDTLISLLNDILTLKTETKLKKIKI